MLIYSQLWLLSIAPGPISLTTEGFQDEKSTKLKIFCKANLIRMPKTFLAKPCGEAWQHLNIDYKLSKPANFGINLKFTCHRLLYV
jgi:hypothetical protein